LSSPAYLKINSIGQRSSFNLRKSALKENKSKPIGDSSPDTAREKRQKIEE
jgi:hypothetical protein